MLLDALGLQLGIVFPLPLQISLAAAALVHPFPGLPALCTSDGSAVRTDQPLLLGSGEESGGALDAPLEVGVLQEGAIA